MPNDSKNCIDLMSIDGCGIGDNPADMISNFSEYFLLSKFSKTGLLQ